VIREKRSTSDGDGFRKKKVALENLKTGSETETLDAL
jgi:hypothetical protein